MNKIMTVREVAQFAPRYSVTIYRLVKANRIPAFKVGSDLRFNSESIQTWIKENSNVVES